MLIDKNLVIHFLVTEERRRNVYQVFVNLLILILTDSSKELFLHFCLYALLFKSDNYYVKFLL